MTHDDELALADQRIARTEGLILRQLQRLEQMEADNQAADRESLAFEGALLALDQCLTVMQKHLLLAQEAPGRASRGREAPPILTRISA